METPVQFSLMLSYLPLSIISNNNKSSYNYVNFRIERIQFASLAKHYRKLRFSNTKLSKSN